MKKLLIATVLALGFVAPASAQTDASIFAANGCDVDTLVPVMSALNENEVLYWQNTNGGGCAVGGRGDGKNILDTIRELTPKVEEEAAES